METRLSKGRSIHDGKSRLGANDERESVKRCELGPKGMHTERETQRLEGSHKLQSCRLTRGNTKVTVC